MCKKIHFDNINVTTHTHSDAIPAGSLYGDSRSRVMTVLYLVLRNLGPRSTPVVPDHHVEAPVVTNCSTAIDTRTPSCRSILIRPGTDQLQFLYYSNGTVKIVATVFIYVYFSHNEQLLNK